MPFRTPGGSRSSIRASSSNQSRGLRNQSNFSVNSGKRRHQFTTAGSPATAVLANQYFYMPLAQFRRTFGASDDNPPTPTASNNFQTESVMNGSRIENYQAKITIKNTSASTGIYLDIYEIAVSFYDVLVWNTIIPTSCPLTFDSTTVGPPDLRGQVDEKAVSATLITDGNFKNYKTVQRYMRKIGTIYLSPSDGNQSQHEVLVNRVPPKCRRSQNGMYWGLFFHNDTTKNNAATFAGVASAEISFDEVPSDNRIQWIP